MDHPNLYLILMMKELTLKQRKFVEEYLKDFNATQAAIRAGYPEKSAHSVGYENLQRPIIKSLIEEFQKRSLEDSFISQTAILQELSRYAFRDRSGNYPELSARVSIQHCTF